MLKTNTTTLQGAKEGVYHIYRAFMDELIDLPDVEDLGTRGQTLSPCNALPSNTRQAGARSLCI